MTTAYLASTGVMGLLVVGVLLWLGRARGWYQYSPAVSSGGWSPGVRRENTLARLAGNTSAWVVAFTLLVVGFVVGVVALISAPDGSGGLAGPALAAGGGDGARGISPLWRLYLGEASRPPELPRGRRVGDGRRDALPGRDNCQAPPPVAPTRSVVCVTQLASCIDVSLPSDCARMSGTSQLSILHVDDDPDLRDLGKLQLEREENAIECVVRCLVPVGGSRRAQPLRRWSTPPRPSARWHRASRPVSCR